MLSPQSPLRLLFLSYLHYNESEQLKTVLSSAQSVLRQQVTSLRKQIDGEYQQILSISNENRHRMSTIRQEESDEEEADTITDQFNRIIGALRAIGGKLTNTVTVYKEELKKLATEVCEWDRKNKDLTKKVEKMKKKIEEEKEQGLLQQKDPEERPLSNQNVQCNLPNKEDRKMWEMLNIRIQGFKKSLKIYEDQIKEKDAQIAVLKGDNKTQIVEKLDKENKVLKRNLTTLRGEKSMMGSQLESLKKVLYSKEKTIETQSLQLNKNRLEIDELSNALKDAQKQLVDMKTGYQNRIEANSTYTRKVEKLEQDLKCYMDRYPKGDFERLRAENDLLSRKLGQTQLNLKQIMQRLTEIQGKYKQISSKDRQTIEQLQQILNQKNETIIKLKASKTDDKYEYYVELVKLLNKKLFDRDHYIQQLKTQLQRN